MIRHYENKHKPKRTSPTAGKLNESKQKGSEKQSSEKQPEINFTAGNRKDFIFCKKNTRIVPAGHELNSGSSIAKTEQGKYFFSVK